MPQENLVNFFKYFSEEPQQLEAIQLLQSAMPDSLLRSDSAWIKKYRDTPPAPAVPHLSNPLPVEYDCQLDHGDEGWRLCFTASCAMAMHYWRPEVPIADYYAKRPSFGDSTDPSAQIRTLQHFGLQTKYVQIGSVSKLKQQIDLGRPTPIGILHHGPVSAPSGGGHWILAVGYTDDHLIACDPYGELDVVNGGYPQTGGTYGKFIKYSWKNLTPRWSVANDHDGWGLGIVMPGKL